ncbi:MAG: serine/threonine-protein kinase [Planctomycetota bacterium]
MEELYEQQLAELLTDLTDRMGRGEELLLEEVCQKHPEFAVDIRDLWGTIAVTQAVAHDSLTRPRTAARDLSLFELPYRLGDFELLEEIGRGGMGIVYRARRLSNGEPLALKMMLKGELASRVERQRFEAEASAAAGLTHPNIIPIFDVGEFGGRPYFTMKLIEGRTLAQWLNAGPISPEKAARLLLQIASAVQQAHEQGILHRDLKPSNILIDEQEHAYVCDFGLAKQVTGATSLTRTGAVIGTPAYMAPEQAAGARGQVGPTSDVYSLGAILYHMLTGNPPFQGASPVDTVLMVLEQDPIPPRVLNRRADRILEMVALKCLQKPQDLRYSSAENLARDLQAYLNKSPVSVLGSRLGQILAGLFRETHHAPVLQNWGLLWIWHSLILLLASFLTNAMYLSGVTNRLVFELMWGTGFTAWAIVFWLLRRQYGPVTFVERQIAHVWAASLIGIVLLFPFEGYLGLELLELSPILAVVAAMTFLVKAGILSGSFYIQAAILIATSVVMALSYPYAMFIFGVVCAGCFFFPGWKYHRQRLRSMNRD